jgi:hypothetical protein
MGVTLNVHLFSFGVSVSLCGTATACIAGSWRASTRQSDARQPRPEIKIVHFYQSYLWLAGLHVALHMAGGFGLLHKPVFALFCHNDATSSPCEALSLASDGDGMSPGAVLRGNFES